MIKGLDYSYARPNPSDIKQRGYNFVARYLSYDQGKNISLQETEALHAQGLGLVLVWETVKAEALNGLAAGVHDATQALSEARSIGFPDSRPIYFTVDFDASEDQQGALNEYFKGVSQVLGLNRTGVYAGYWICKRLLDAGLVTYAWQTLAWSGGNIDPRIHIYQDGGQDFNGGADINEARQADYGQWPKGEEVDILTDFRNCFITQAQTWPTQEQEQAFQASGDTPYHWVQVNAPSPAVEAAKADQRVADLVTQDEAVRAATEPLQAQIKALQDNPQVVTKTVTQEIQTPISLSAYSVTSLLNEVESRLVSWLKGRR